MHDAWHLAVLHGIATSDLSIACPHADVLPQVYNNEKGALLCDVL